MTVCNPSRWGKTLLLLPLFISAVAEAKTVMPDIYIPITGTIIVSAPCKINDDRTLEVDFGNDVMTTRVDGNNYRRAIAYNLDCSTASSNALRMQIQGTAAAFDGKVLGTAERSDLGIALSANGRALPINTWLKFRLPSQPALSAVPVKRPGATLSGGAFSAGATLLVEYQ